MRIDMLGDEIRIRDAVIVHEKNELTRCMFEAIVPCRCRTEIDLFDIRDIRIASITVLTEQLSCTIV